MGKVIKNVVCPICGCLCDDIEVEIEDNTIKRVRNSCSISAAKFLNYNKDRITSPLIRSNGELKPVGLDESIEKVAKLLAKSEYPLLFGFSLSTCEATKVGIELAETLGGVIDNQTAVCHGSTVLGFHESGASTASLGEIRHRADLIIYWGANPTDAHPRHFERYTVNSEGKFRKGKKDRKLVIIDTRKTTSSRYADYFYEIEQGKDYELISAIRMALKFEEILDDKVAGLDIEKVEELAELMRSCEFGVIFFGLGLTQTRGKGRNIECLFSLVRDLNSYTKFVVMPARGHFNVTGSNEVMAWITGFPYAVDFSKGYPWYNPGETTAVDILLRRENDVTLIVGSDPVAHFPKKAIEHLVKNPLVVIDPCMSLTALAADIVIPSAYTGIEVAGTAYRMDTVPILLKKVVEPPNGILPDEIILRRILNKVKKIKEGE
jgi:formylmethanofuran dehydrogenase subunit B